MFINRKARDAFTMLELVFVIAILGIVSAIGAEVIAKVYESYITQRALHRASIKTELVATQIANRLAYSIPNTIIGRIGAAGTFLPIGSIPAGDIAHTTLEWIGYDSDGFGVSNGAGSAAPKWSGYADVDNSAVDTLSSPGSAFTAGVFLNTIIGFLSLPGAKGIADTAVLFPGTYTENNVGYAGNGAIDTSGIHPVASAATNTSLTLVARANRTIKEHYKLAWTAYAIEPVPVANPVLRGFQAGDNLWDLTLHYDYQPWNGDALANGSNQILIRNISVFQFTSEGNTIRFKICQRESIGGAFSINTCKEKAVIR